MIRTLVTAPLLLAAALFVGCQTIDPDAFTDPGTVDSDMHDIRFSGLFGPWEASDEAFGAVFLGEDREGWNYLWRVGAGEILGDSTAPDLLWRTPLLDRSWIELSIERNGERHLCRRVFDLAPWEPTLALTTDASPWLPDPFGAPEHWVVAHVGGAPNMACDLVWGSEAGTLRHGDANSRSVLWGVRRAGVHRVWAELDCDWALLSDTLTVEVGQVAPVVFFWEGDHPWEPGGLARLELFARDGNEDPLELEVVALESMELESLVAHGPSPDGEIQGHWILDVRIAPNVEGLLAMDLRLDDGALPVDLRHYVQAEIVNP